MDLVKGWSVGGYPPGEAIRREYALRVAERRIRDDLSEMGLLTPRLVHLMDQVFAGLRQEANIDALAQEVGRKAFERTIAEHGWQPNDDFARFMAWYLSSGRDQD